MLSTLTLVTPDSPAEMASPTKIVGIDPICSHSLKGDQFLHISRPGLLDLPDTPDADSFSVSRAATPLDTFLVNSPAQARDLIKQYSLGLSNSLPPEIFWVTVERGKWRPRVLCVKRGDLVIGFVYLKERMLAGIPSGLVHGDSSMRSMIDSAALDRELVLSTALNFLFSRRSIFGASIYMPSGGLQHRTFADVAEHANLELAYSVPPVRHSRLLLPQDYESFLRSLGPHTRRNLRYYRRRFEAAGHIYVDNLSSDDFRSISRELRGKSRIPTAANLVQRSINIVESAKRPLIWGLCGADGRWMSVLVGWREDDKVTFFFQMNSDLDHPRDSLSMVLRGYVLESLIESGVHTLDFWWGIIGPLAVHARPFPTVNVTLQSKALHSRMLGRLLATLKTHYPTVMPKC